jgi:hypothetical protein
VSDQPETGSHFKSVHLSLELHVSDWVTLYHALQSHKMYSRFRAELDSLGPSAIAMQHVEIELLEEKILKLITPYHINEKK